MNNLERMQGLVREARQADRVGDGDGFRRALLEWMDAVTVQLKETTEVAWRAEREAHGAAMPHKLIG